MLGRRCMVLACVSDMLGKLHVNTSPSVSQIEKSRLFAV